RLRSPLPVPVKDFRADRQNDGREADGARDGIECLPAEDDQQKPDRDSRDEQERQERPDLPFLPRRDEPPGQFLENEKAENNDGGTYCQGDSRPPAEEERPEGENQGDPEGSRPDSMNDPFFGHLGLGI